MKSLILKNIKKKYGSGQKATIALRNISFSIKHGEFTAIMGESGSGKSTLLNLIATLDQATQGEIKLDNYNLEHLKDKQSADFRKNHLGFIFQEFNLLDIFNCKDNILLPIVLAKKEVKKYQSTLNHITKKLNINNLLQKYPYQLSGGQKQRIAAARALITNPDLILADEPTGALDSGTSQRLLRLLQDFNHNGQTILMVSHSPLAASYANRVLFIKDGVIFNQIFKGNQSNQEFYDAIINANSVLNR